MELAACSKQNVSVTCSYAFYCSSSLCISAFLFSFLLVSAHFLCYNWYALQRSYHQKLLLFYPELLLQCKPEYQNRTSVVSVHKISHRLGTDTYFTFSKTRIKINFPPKMLVKSVNEIFKEFLQLFCFKTTLFIQKYCCNWSIESQNVSTLQRFAIINILMY